MRLRMILALLLAFGVAACESTPDETSSTTGGGFEEPVVATVGDADDDIIVETEPEPLVEVDTFDPNEPIPGSQNDLVQKVGDRVFFELDSAVLGPEARRTLDRQATWLELFPEVEFVIEGHCDERGTREYNLALGERRANAVREYLIAQGVEPSRLRTLSYGKERPYAMTHNEEAWALNRRSVSVVE